MLNENQVSVDQKVKQFKEFILFCKKQYGLKSLPKFKWFTHSNVGHEQPTFGAFQNEDQTISIGINNRHPLDIMRTIAHELWHYKQLLNNELGNNSGETGSPQENAANAQAGIIMRNWNKLHPEMFAQSPVEKLEESFNNQIPNDVTDFIDSLSSDDVGKERIGDYVVHFEGFSDVCQADAEERTQLSPNDPRYLACYDAIYKEVLNDFINREAGAEPVSAGLAGDELYPVYYAVFHKPAITEAELNHISQYHEDGGSLEGYVVDTDQPQLENYLTSQGAAPELIAALRSRYNRIAIIRNMWVDEELRGGGIGTDLVGQAIGDAFSSGAEAIVLVADMAESNVMPLDKWYESFGFNTVGVAGGDPVMVLDRELNESWTKKYKKSINCSNPKGFSQKAHCAGRRARQAGKKTKSKSINETRDAFLAYVKQKFPRMPDYVARDLIYKNSKKYPENVAGVWTSYYGSYDWKLVNEFKVDNKIWDAETLGRIQRNMRTADSDSNPKDKQRFAQQRKMVQQKGISREPIIVEESREQPGKYTLLEGLHRTVETLRANPQGYTCPAYIGSPTRTTEKIRAKAPDGFWQKLKKKVLGENFADGKGPGRPGDSQRHGIPKGATIAQLEKAAKAPGRKGQLARWQLNMRRGRAKNESVVNEGITVYHSSAQPSISKFNPFSHFGTEKAAADRIKFLIKQKKLAKDAPVTVYKIDLDIHKTAVIKDAAVQHDSTQYAFALKDAKIFTQEEMMSITTRKALMPGGWDQAAYNQTEKESLELLNKMLKDKGYDGLAYKNKYEDKGQMSYVILDPNQAKVVGKETVPAQEFVQKFAVTTEARAYMKAPSLYKDPITPVTFKSKIVAKFPDGDVVDTQHVLERMAQRGVYESTLIQVISDAAKYYPDKLKNMSSQGFIIKQNTKTGNYKGGVGAALHKNPQKDGTWKYSIKTVHHNFYVMDKNLNEILFVPPLNPKEEKNFLNLQKQIMKEDAVLDKPTPTVGELAEKYHTSLLAVKQQLARGIKVEMEHTTKIRVAREIALDHLGEDLYYYKKLAKIEKTK